MLGRRKQAGAAFARRMLEKQRKERKPETEEKLSAAAKKQVEQFESAFKEKVARCGSRQENKRMLISFRDLFEWTFF